MLFHQCDSSHDAIRAVGRLMAAAFCFVLMTHPNALYGQVKNDPDLYPLTGKANQANRDAIMTWEGAVEVNTRHAGFNPQSPYFYTTKSEIRFYYDRKQSKLLFNEKTTYYPNGLTGEKFKDIELYTIANGMRTAHAFYEYPCAADPPLRGFDPPPGLLPPNRFEWTLAVRKNNDESFDEYGRHFDPFRFFELLGRGELHQAFTAYRDSVEKNTHKTISRNGDIVKLSILAGQDFNHRYQFDLKQGGNPIHMDMESLGQSETRTRQFEMVNKIWVPKSATIKQRSNRESKTLEYQWLRQKVNEPLPYDIFAMKNLRVQTGDTVIDYRGPRPSTSKYEEGKIPGGQPNDDKNR